MISVYSIDCDDCLSYWFILWYTALVCVTEVRVQPLKPRGLIVHVLYLYSDTNLIGCWVIPFVL